MEFTEIKDIRNHTVCYLDTETGLITTKYKSIYNEQYLMKGKKTRFIRNGIETTIYHAYKDYYKITSNIVN
jgi:hypothetical protein